MTWRYEFKYFSTVYSLLSFVHFQEVGSTPILLPSRLLYHHHSWDLAASAMSSADETSIRYNLLQVTVRILCQLENLDRLIQVRLDDFIGNPRLRNDGSIFKLQSWSSSLSRFVKLTICSFWHALGWGQVVRIHFGNSTKVSLGVTRGINTTRSPGQEFSVILWSQDRKSVV